MKNLKIFSGAMATKRHWKFSGKTNKAITNVQRMWLALSHIIGGLVTLVTLGNITCWADISMGLKFAAQKDCAE